MEKEIYRGLHPGVLKTLEEAVFVASYQRKYNFAEEADVSIYHRDGVTIKQVVDYVVHGVVVGGQPSSSTPPQTTISVYGDSTNETALSVIEQRILQEIRNIRKRRLRVA